MAKEAADKARKKPTLAVEPAASPEELPAPEPALQPSEPAPAVSAGAAPPESPQIQEVQKPASQAGESVPVKPDMGMVQPEARETARKQAGEPEGRAPFEIPKFQISEAELLKEEEESSHVDIAPIGIGRYRPGPPDDNASIREFTDYIDPLGI